jgi:hypothetical protein
MTVTSSKRLGIVLKPGSNNTGAAFLAGRQIGMRCGATDAAATIDQLLDELRAAQAETARLTAELAHERRVHALMREMFIRSEKIAAVYERAFDGPVTLH